MDKTRVLNLQKVNRFSDLLQKLYLGNQSLNNKERQFLLSVAILLLRKYQKNIEYRTSFELGYCIILKYCLLFKDWTPLYDFAINFGFYPIAQTIKANSENLFHSIANETLEILTEEMFSYNGNIETKEQKKSRESILANNEIDISYIAPTSFGKSKIIIEHIRKNLAKNKKFAIVVPTKSLLMQTFLSVKKERFGIRLFIHDEMYTGDNGFIAVLTQERALRLLDKHDISFDFLYIDEAHKLLDLDSRSVLLARLIKTNSIRNPNAKTIYLSPMLNRGSSISINHKRINEEKIDFNMKEPDIYEYTLSGEERIYNRFFNVFYDCPEKFEAEKPIKYIEIKKANKNFIYLYSPKKVERFAAALFSEMQNIDLTHIPDIQETILNLKSYVHDDFYVSKYLEKGIIYIHGKIPDTIKDYLEYKFNTIPEIQFLIANNVILEGVNLPIDSLFILQPYKLDKKSLVNLIGRVNRLNLIFTEDINDLSKLSPKVHFVNNVEFYGRNHNMENKIQLLRSNDFKDEIKNPLLDDFDIDMFRAEDVSQRQKCETIIRNDEVVFATQYAPEHILKQNMLKLGLDIIYKISDELCVEINSRIETVRHGGFNGSILEIMRFIFVINFDEHIIDAEFLRLKNNATVSYYEHYLEKYAQKSLKERVTLMARYFRMLSKTHNTLMYVGNSFGEIDINGNRSNSVLNYVDLREKTPEDMVNIAIIKIKMEEDFISFKLSKFFQLLFDYALISQEQYNKLIYGTADPFKLSLAKQGISLSIINKLIEDGQQHNIYTDENGNLTYNEEFRVYKENQDDLFQFELNKLL